MDFLHLGEVDEAVVVDADESGPGQVFFEELEQADTVQRAPVLKVEMGDVSGAADIEEVITGNTFDGAAGLDKYRLLDGGGSIHKTADNNGYLYTKISGKSFARTYVRQIFYIRNTLIDKWLIDIDKIISAEKVLQALLFQFFHLQRGPDEGGDAFGIVGPDRLADIVGEVAHPVGRAAQSAQSHPTSSLPRTCQ